MNANAESANNKALAEVVDSNLSTLVAQCWQWDAMPAFGSLVCVQEKTGLVFGLVSNLQTGSMDPQRYPFPYQKTEDELRTQHPQIFEFLKTTFDVCIVGHRPSNGLLSYTLPSFPAKIHSFVAPATAQQMHQFFTNPAFLSLLFANQNTGPHLDDVLLAMFNLMAQHELLTAQRFEQYYHTFSLLVGNDYRRLKLLLARVSTQHAQLLTGLTLPERRA